MNLSAIAGCVCDCVDVSLLFPLDGRREAAKYIRKICGRTLMVGSLRNDVSKKLYIWCFRTHFKQ